MIDELKKLFGRKCTSVNINGITGEFLNEPLKQMKFCEAVNYSFNIPIRLTEGNLGCPGARRCMGFNNDETMLAQTIAENNKIPISFIVSAMKKIPVLQGIRFINLGMPGFMESELIPDLFILYVQPSQITSIMHSLAKHKMMPSVPAFSLLSVCGNIFANCCKNKVISISFGCPESRKHGGIEKNEVVLGVPYADAPIFVELIKNS